MSLHSVLENVYWVDRSLLHFCGGGKSKYHKKIRASDRKTAVLKTRLTSVQRFYRRKPTFTKNWRESETNLAAHCWVETTQQGASSFWEVTINENFQENCRSLKEKKYSLSRKEKEPKQFQVSLQREIDTFWWGYKNLLQICGGGKQRINKENEHIC